MSQVLPWSAPPEHIDFLSLPKNCARVPSPDRREHEEKARLIIANQKSPLLKSRLPVSDNRALRSRERHLEAEARRCGSRREGPFPRRAWELRLAQSSRRCGVFLGGAFRISQDPLPQILRTEPTDFELKCIPSQFKDFEAGSR